MSSVTQLKFPSLEELEVLTATFSEVDHVALYAYNELTRSAKEVLSLVDKRHSAYGQSVARTAAMWHMQHANGNVTPAALAEALNVTRAYVTSLIAGMEKSGFLVKRPSTGDRRQYFIALTEKGKQESDASWPRQAATVTKLMSGLNSKEQHTLIRLMGKIHRQTALLSKDKDFEI